MAANPRSEPTRFNPQQDREQHREQKRAYNRTYGQQHRKELNAREAARRASRKKYTPVDELTAFIPDPLRETKLAQSDPYWQNVKVCRFCGLHARRLSDHLLTQERSKIVALFVKWFPERSGEIERLSGTELLAGYKREFGYSKSEGLNCAATFQRMAAASAGRIGRIQRRQRCKGAANKAALAKGRLELAKYGVSLAARERKSITQTGRALPSRWRTDASGAVLTDWTLAQLRRHGETLDEIAARVGMDFGTVGQRLRRIGFPSGTTCYRGEHLTEKHLQLHFQELLFVRIYREIVFRIARTSSRDELVTCSELAKLLRVNARFVRQRTNRNAKNPIPHEKIGGVLLFDLGRVLLWLQRGRHPHINGHPRFNPLAKRPVENELATRIGVCRSYLYQVIAGLGFYRRRQPNRPVSRRVARGLLRSMDMLRGEWRTLGPTPQGGPPKKLLPSEEKELPRKYQLVYASLEILSTWAEAQTTHITLEMIGNYLCAQSRRKKLRVLLFWPSLDPKLPKLCEAVRTRVRGGRGVAERTKELLCEEYGISRRTLHGILEPKGSAKTALPVQ
jgi:hypothetical protein